MSQGGPRAPTSLLWIIVLLLLLTSASVAGNTASLKKTKQVYVYSGTVSKPSQSGSFELLSTSDKHAKPSPSTTTRRPVAAVTTTESPLAKEALIAFPPSASIEARPNHGSFVHFPSGGGAGGALISSTTAKPIDTDYGAPDILGEAIDQDAFGSSHHVIRECDGDECCPGPHCTKHLICHHGHDCYYVPHKKPPHHYSTYRPTEYHVDPPQHRPYNPAPRPAPRPAPTIAPTIAPNRKPHPSKTKISSHYSARPSLHQGSYRPQQSHHVTVIKPAVKTKKPAPSKSGFGTGAIAILDEADPTPESRLGKKKHFKKKKFLKKYLLPLLMAYKMLFIVLVPVMVKTMMMMVSTSGMTGFFVALFGAAVTFHFYHSKMNAPPTSITLSSPPPSPESTKITKVIKYLPLPPPMMTQPMPLPPPPPPPPPPPQPPPQVPSYGPPPPPPSPPQFPEDSYGGGYHYPNYYQWMDKRRSKKRKKNNKSSMLPSLSFFR